MGCPVGIGPEIIHGFFQSHENTVNFQPLVLGDLARMKFVGSLLGIDKKVVSWLPGDNFTENTLPVLDLTALPENSLSWGQPDLSTGRAMAEYIIQGVELIQKDLLAGIVTCPITKSALNNAGFDYPGHTEMLGDLTGVSDFRMMMAGENLKVVLVTIHEQLKRVPDLLTEDEIVACITMTIKSLQQDFALPNPRIGVAGLNPHSGEQGMFGWEEESLISPAIEQCKKLGAVVSGPYPPDTVFYRAASGEFDAVIAMYHDQGLIPFKLLHFSDGVNVTLGLPIVRTSVDHGTAYDIAGTGKADSSSLKSAWNLATKIVSNRSKGIV